MSSWTLANHPIRTVVNSELFAGAKCEKTPRCGGKALGPSIGIYSRRINPDTGWTLAGSVCYLKTCDKFATAARMLGQNLQADFNVSARPVSTVLFDLRRSLDEGRSVFRKVAKATTMWPSSSGFESGSAQLTGCFANRPGCPVRFRARARPSRGSMQRKKYPVSWSFWPNVSRK